MAATARETMRDDVLGIMLTSTEAKPPLQQTPGSAGFDMHAAEGCVIAPGQRSMISTGVSIHLPRGHYGQLLGRSGLACRHGVVVLGGVIDPDYRGEVKVMLLNTGDAALTVTRGDRIAQLVLIKYASPAVVMLSELAPTTRGADGFGSTGK